MEKLKILLSALLIIFMFVLSFLLISCKEKKDYTNQFETITTNTYRY